MQGDRLAEIRVHAKGHDGRDPGVEVTGALLHHATQRGELALAICVEALQQGPERERAVEDVLELLLHPRREAVVEQRREACRHDLVDRHAGDGRDERPVAAA